MMLTIIVEGHTTSPIDDVCIFIGQAHQLANLIVLTEYEETDIQPRVAIIVDRRSGGKRKQQSLIATHDCIALVADCATYDIDSAAANQSIT